uniref:Uncharacterized protein n=1 Tax=Alexandrium catenella TaxID=2925 RepID=A0A7S1MFU7_ALECA
MPVFMDPGIELTALLITAIIAAPAILLLCCILEECPLKSKDTLEDMPLLCGMTATDCSGKGDASLLCFFFVIVVIAFFTTASGMFFMAWRGAVMASPQGTTVAGAIGTFSFLATAAAPRAAPLSSQKRGRPASVALLQEPLGPPALPLQRGPPQSLAAFGAVWAAPVPAPRRRSTRGGS